MIIRSNKTKKNYLQVWVKDKVMYKVIWYLINATQAINAVQEDTAQSGFLWILAEEQEEVGGNHGLIDKNKF